MSELAVTVELVVMVALAITVALAVKVGLVATVALAVMVVLAVMAELVELVAKVVRVVNTAPGRDNYSTVPRRALTTKPAAPLSQVWVGKSAVLVVTAELVVKVVRVVQKNTAKTPHGAGFNGVLLSYRMSINPSLPRQALCRGARSRPLWSWGIYQT